MAFIVVVYFLSLVEHLYHFWKLFAYFGNWKRRTSCACHAVHQWNFSQQTWLSSMYLTSVYVLWSNLRSIITLGQYRDNMHQPLKLKNLWSHAYLSSFTRPMKSYASCWVFSKYFIKLICHIRSFKNLKSMFCDSENHMTNLHH